MIPRTSRRRRTAALVGMLGAVMMLATPALGDTADVINRDAPTIARLAVAEEFSAAAWILVEADTGQVIAEHRSVVQRPVASTIKVLTALTVLQDHALNELVTVGEEVDGIGGASVGLEKGDVWTIEQLLDGLIARSGNDAAEVLAVNTAGSREAFVTKMRDVAEQLDMQPIHLASPSGLDDENLVSARALARLGRAALAHNDLRRIVGRPVVELPGEGSVASRNELLTSYPGATGIKTGFTDAAGNSMIASARRNGRELIAVILGSGSEDARFTEAAALLDFGFGETTAVEYSAHVSLRRAGGRSREFDGPLLSFTLDRGAQPTATITALGGERPAVRVQYGSAQTTDITMTSRSDTRSTDAADISVSRLVVDAAYDALQQVSVDGPLR